MYDLYIRSLAHLFDNTMLFWNKIKSIFMHNYDVLSLKDAVAHGKCSPGQNVGTLEFQVHNSEYLQE